MTIFVGCAAAAFACASRLFGRHRPRTRARRRTRSRVRHGTTQKLDQGYGDDAIAFYPSGWTPVADDVHPEFRGPVVTGRGPRLD
jgi:hypothetical protein